MKILITGGAGFIGSNLALRLLAAGNTVTVLDSLAPQIHGLAPENTSPLYKSISDKVRFVRGSVCDESVWVDALQDQEAIVHLAAETGTGQSMYEIRRYTEVNVGGTAIMLNLLANRPSGVRRVIVASSRAIYGEGKYFSKSLGVVYPSTRRDADMKAGRFEPLCPSTGSELRVLATDEDSKVHPTSVYGITKSTQEQMVLTVCSALGIQATALRYQNVYGPGQSLTNPYTGILSIFSTRILNGNPISIFEDGKETRDFIFIDDVVDATLAALFRSSGGSEVYGIGSGVSTSVLSVGEILISIYESSVPLIVTGEYRVGDIRHNFADTAKAKEHLGFSAKVDFNTGISRFAEWVKMQRVPEDEYENSLMEMKTRGLFKK